MGVPAPSWGVAPAPPAASLARCDGCCRVTLHRAPSTSLHLPNANAGLRPAGGSLSPSHRSPSACRYHLQAFDLLGDNLDDHTVALVLSALNAQDGRLTVEEVGALLPVPDPGGGGYPLLLRSPWVRWTPVPISTAPHPCHPLAPSGPLTRRPRFLGVEDAGQSRQPPSPPTPPHHCRPPCPPIPPLPLRSAWMRWMDAVSPLRPPPLPPAAPAA